MTEQRRKRLYLLEARAALVCMGKAMIVMAATISLAAFFLWCYLRINPDEDVIRKIEIGVVSMDDSAEMETLNLYLQSMPVLKVLCRLHMMDEQEALDGLRDGELQMVVKIPPHFLEDAVHMQEATLKIDIPDGRTYETQRMLALFTGVERVMLTTESAILSMYDGMQYASFGMSVSEMERSLTNLYVDRFLNRDGYFALEYLSPYGDFTPLQYYGVSLLLLFTALFCVCFFGLYEQETIRLEKLLNPGGQREVVLSVMKIICMGIPVILWIWIVLLAFHAAFAMLNLPGFYVNGASFGIGALIGITLAAGVQLFVSLFGNGIRARLSFVIFLILLWLTGGVLGSSYYLPHFMQHLTGCNPAAIWVSGMLKGLFGETDARSLGVLFLIFILTGALGVVSYRKCLQRSR